LELHLQPENYLLKQSAKEWEESKSITKEAGYHQVINQTLLFSKNKVTVDPMLEQDYIL
jgi:hypothetical protein